MINTALQKILENTFTKQDFYARIGLVQECLEHSIYDSENDIENRAMHCAEYARSKNQTNLAPYIEEWGNEVFAIFSAENIYNQIRDLKEMVENLPELVLYVPVDITGKNIESIGQVVREKFGAQVMIDLMIESNALGGCAFVWNGKYHDFTLNYFLKEKQSEVANLIRSYDAK